MGKIWGWKRPKNKNPEPQKNFWRSYKTNRVYWIFHSSEAGHVLNMFLNFQKFEPQCSYKHGSYSTFSVYQLYFLFQQSNVRVKLETLPRSALATILVYLLYRLSIATIRAVWTRIRSQFATRFVKNKFVRTKMRLKYGTKIELQSDLSHLSDVAIYRSQMYGRSFSRIVTNLL